MAKVLSAVQIETYTSRGFLAPLDPVYSDEQIREIREGLVELIALLEPEESTKEIRERPNPSPGIKMPTTGRWIRWNLSPSGWRSTTWTKKTAPWS